MNVGKGRMGVAVVKVKVKKVKVQTILSTLKYLFRQIIYNEPPHLPQKGEEGKQVPRHFLQQNLEV